MFLLHVPGPKHQHVCKQRGVTNVTELRASLANFIYLYTIAAQHEIIAFEATILLSKIAMCPLSPLPAAFVDRREVVHVVGTMRFHSMFLEWPFL
jgi:hypothetical protein